MAKSNMALCRFRVDSDWTLCKGQLTVYSVSDTFSIFISTACFAPLTAVCTGVILCCSNFLSLSVLPYAPSKWSSFRSGIFSLIVSKRSCNTLLSSLFRGFVETSVMRLTLLSGWAVSTMLIVYPLRVLPSLLRYVASRSSGDCTEELVICAGGFISIFCCTILNCSEYTRSKVLNISYSA